MKDSATTVQIGMAMRQRVAAPEAVKAGERTWVRAVVMGGGDGNTKFCTPFSARPERQQSEGCGAVAERKDSRAPWGGRVGHVSLISFRSVPHLAADRPLHPHHPVHQEHQELFVGRSVVVVTGGVDEEIDAVLDPINHEDTDAEGDVFVFGQQRVDAVHADGDDARQKQEQQHQQQCRGLYHASEALCSKFR